MLTVKNTIDSMITADVVVDGCDIWRWFVDESLNWAEADATAATGVVIVADDAAVAVAFGAAIVDDTEFSARLLLFDWFAILFTLDAFLVGLFLFVLFAWPMLVIVKSASIDGAAVEYSNEFAAYKWLQSSMRQPEKNLVRRNFRLRGGDGEWRNSVHSQRTNGTLLLLIARHELEWRTAEPCLHTSHIRSTLFAK